MSKIEFDASRVRRSKAAEETVKLYEKYSAALAGECTMDDKTKEAIADLLGTVKKRPTASDYRTGSKPAAYRSPYSYRDTKPSAEEARKEAMDREESARELERARLEREEEAKVRAEIKRHREHFAQLSQPVAIYAREELRNHTAALSVNTAKACIVLRCMLCKELTDQFTREIHASKRLWNGIDGVFEFHPSAMPQVKGILALYFKDVQVVGVPKAIPSTKFDQLVAKLTKEDKAKVYRLLAGIYHPDRGGSSEVMTLLNLVFKEK